MNDSVRALAARLSRLPFGFGLTLTLVAVSLFNLQLIVRALPVGYPVSDYRFPETAAHAAFAHGWSHIYDFSLPNPPPFVWLTAPFALLPGPAGYALWALLMLGCLVLASQLVAAPGRHSRIRALTVVLALLPAMAVIIFGQVAALVILAVAACWVLARRGHDTLAGAVLAVGVVKPHLLLLVPFTLLLAGHQRIFLGWAGAATVLAVLSVASLGPDATTHYVNFMTHFDTGKRGSYSLAGLLGSGLASVGARAAVIAVAGIASVLARRRSREEGIAVALSAGVAASLLISGYLNPFDLALYAPLILILALLGSAWRLPILVASILWVALEIAISSGALIVLLEAIFLVALVQPLVSVSSLRSRGEPLPAAVQGSRLR